MSVLKFVIMVSQGVVEQGGRQTEHHVYAAASVRPWEAGLEAAIEQRRSDLNDRMVSVLERKERFPVGPMLGVVFDLGNLSVSAFNQFLEDVRVLGSPRVGVKDLGNNLMLVGFVEANAGERVISLLRETQNRLPNQIKSRIVRGGFINRAGELDVISIEQPDKLKNDFNGVTSGQVVVDGMLAQIIANPVEFAEERRLFATARADCEQIDDSGLFEITNLRAETNLAQDGPLDLVGNEDVFDNMTVFLQEQSMECRLDGEMGVGKTKMLSMLAKFLEENSLGLALPVSFHSKAKDPLYKNVPYFAFGRMMDFVGTFLNNLVSKIDNDFFDRVDVRYLIYYSNLSESQQISQFNQHHANLLVENVVSVIAALAQFLIQGQKSLVLMLDDFHNMADNDSRQLMKSFVDLLKKQDYGGVLKIIYSGRDEQYHEGADQYLLDRNVRVFKLERPKYLQSVENAINEDRSEVSLAEKFILGSFRGSLAGETLLEDLRMDKQQVLRIARLAKDLPLIFVTFVNRIRRDYQYLQAKGESTAEILEIKDNVLIINEQYLKGLEVDNEQGECFSGEQLQVELMTRLLSLEKLDPKLKNFLSLIAITGGLQIPNGETRNLNAILKDKLNDHDFDLFKYVTALINTGYLRMERNQNGTLVNFIHEESAVVLNKLLTSQQKNETVKLILAKKELWSIMKPAEILNLIQKGLADNLIDQSELIDLLPFLTENLMYQFDLARNYQSVVDFCGRLFESSKLKLIFGQLLKPKENNAILTDLEQKIWPLIFIYAKSASELASSKYADFKELFIANKAYFSITANVRKYPGLSFGFGEALSYMIDRQAVFRGEDKNHMSDASEIVGLVSETEKDDKSKLRELLISLRSYYRNKNYDMVLNTIDNHKPTIGEKLLAEELELKQIYARALYEQVRNNGLNNFKVKDFDPDIKCLDQRFFAGDLDLSQELQYLKEKLEPIIKELYIDTLLYPTKYTRRYLLAIADLAAGYNLLVGNNQDAIGIANAAYLKETASGKGALPDPCGRLLHHRVSAQIRSGNNLYDLLENLFEEKDKLLGLGLPPTEFVAKLLDYDLLRVLMLLDDEEMFALPGSVSILGRLFVKDKMSPGHAYGFYGPLGYYKGREAAYLDANNLVSGCKFALGITMFDKGRETAMKKQGLVNCLNLIADKSKLGELLPEKWRNVEIQKFKLSEDGQICAVIEKPRGDLCAEIWEMVGSPTDNDVEENWLLPANPNEGLFVNCLFVQ